MLNLGLCTTMRCSSRINGILTLFNHMFDVYIFFVIFLQRNNVLKTRNEHKDMKKYFK